jgi:hypothetical protein
MPCEEIPMRSLLLPFLLRAVSSRSSPLRRAAPLPVLLLLMVLPKLIPAVLAMLRSPEGSREVRAVPAPARARTRRPARA